MRGYSLPAFNALRDVCAAPKLREFPLVRVHILKAFYGTEQRVLKEGETVKLPEPDAREAVALGKAEYV